MLCNPTFRQFELKHYPVQTVTTITQRTGVDYSQCPTCKTGKMEIVAS